MGGRHLCWRRTVPPRPDKRGECSFRPRWSLVRRGQWLGYTAQALLGYKPVESADVGLGAGDDDVGGSAPTGEHLAVLAYPDHPLADGVQTFGDGVDVEVRKPGGDAGGPLYGLAYGVHRAVARGRVAVDLLVRAQDPNRGGGDVAVATGELDLVQDVGYGLRGHALLLGHQGLQVPVGDLMLLVGQELERREGAVGSIVVATMEGRRPMLIEVQALTSPSYLPTPRRIATGLDVNRLLLICAVLTRRAGISLGNQDVVVNVTGGFRIREPAADLGVALAIASSLHDVPLDQDLAAMGEVGLSGEVRRVSQLDQRIAEVDRLGLNRCIVPASPNDEIETQAKTKITKIATLSQALAASVP